MTWYGGKRRLAQTILDRLGRVEVYAEPFAGSLACLLASEPHAREVACDVDGGIVNFWRALRSDPEAVAYHADWPTFHDDLTARHRWLVLWVLEHGERLREDPDYCDAKAAGWWVWGISIWIGGGWCQPNYRAKAAPDRIPKFAPTPGGGGVSQQSGAVPKGDGKIPKVHTPLGGSGVDVQRRETLPVGDGQIPYPGAGNQPRAAKGVSVQRVAAFGYGESPCDGTRLLPWLTALAGRLQRVIVLNRDWRSAVTPSVLAQTPTGPKPPVGILLDPPYLTEERSSEVYGSDMDGSSSAVAADAWKWAQEHGDRYRIAYCAHEGDVEVPDGWDVVTETFSGIRDADRRKRRDMVLFSPACQPVKQSMLW